MSSRTSVRARAGARRLPRGWRVPHRWRIPRHRQIRPRRRVPWGWWRISRRRCNRRSVSGPTTACDAVQLLAVQLIGYAIARPRGVLVRSASHRVRWRHSGKERIRRSSCAASVGGRRGRGWCALLDLRPAGRRSGKQCGNNQNCQDMVHGAHSRKGRSSLHLHRGGSGRVLLSNTYPLHAAIDGDP